MSGPLLEVKGLHIGFGGKDVVHGIDFALHPGEKLALVGESMEFPIAHSWRLAVITTHSGGPIGADVERIRPIENLRGICAERFAAAGARQSFAPKPGGSRDFFLA